MTLPLDRRLEALRSWERLVRAGIPMGRCAEVLRGQLPGPTGSRLTTALATGASRGANLASLRPVLVEAFGESVAGLLVAGEEAGRLELALEGAISQIEGSRALRRKLVYALAYPLLLTAAGAVLLPLGSIARNGLVATIRSWYLPMAVVVGAVGGGVFLLRQIWFGGGTRKARFEAALLRTPLLGAFWRAWVESLFFDALGHLLEAGLSTGRALETALRASGSAMLQAETTGWLRRADGEGAGLVEILGDHPLVGAEARVRLTVAEETGDWGAVCKGIAEAAREEAGRKGTALALALGVAVTALVALALVGYVIYFWTSYFGRIGEMV